MYARYYEVEKLESIDLKPRYDNNNFIPMNPFQQQPHSPNLEMSHETSVPSFPARSEEERRKDTA